MSNVGSTDPTWTRRDVRWTFRLGEIPLWSAGLKVAVRNGHFTEIGFGQEDPRPPEGAASGAIEGVLIRSHPIANRLPRLAVVEGRLRYCPSQYRRHWVDLTGTFADYLNRFSSKSRSTLQRKVRNFQRQSDENPPWREYKTPEEIREFYPLAREVSRKTYQERLLKVGLPADEAFREELDRMARENRVRGYLLFRQGRPIAYLYCPVWAGTGIVLYMHLGYDPEFERESPGTVLQYFAFERLFDEPAFTMFDFLEGETPQKEFFATDSALCADIFFLRRTPRVLALIAMREATEGLSGAVVWALERLGIKRWAKRLFRRGGAPASRRDGAAS